MRVVTMLIVAAAVAVGSRPIARAQQNGEAASFVPVVERERYDVPAFMAPLRLTESQAHGRRLVAQRCANCHGGNARQPGPLLGKDIVAARGAAFVREKVKRGSALMPGFEHTLQPSQIDDIIAFLETYSPAVRAPATAQE